MAKKKSKDFTVNVDPKSVMYTSINTSRDGYNSARMVTKVADKQYMSISFEWEGSGVPDFALDLMDFMKTNNVETSGVWEGHEESYEEFSCKTCKKHNPKKNKKMEDKDE